MTDYPPIAIGIITYNRFSELMRVLESLHQHLVYPRDKLIWILCDDGSPGNYINRVTDFYHFDHVIVNQRGGMPVNWNSMVKACEERAEIGLMCQDDWRFTCPLDLRVAVRFLEHNPEYGMLRYHKLTGHVGLPLVVKEWNAGVVYPNFHYGQYEYAPQMLPFVEILPPFDNSNTYSPYSGGVHLRHKRFTQMYGYYQEGAGFSNAEGDYMARVNGRLRLDLNTAQRIAMFPSYFDSRFEDIGVSYRGTEVEKETVKA